MLLYFINCGDCIFLHLFGCLSAGWDQDDVTTASNTSQVGVLLSQNHECARQCATDCDKECQKELWIKKPECVSKCRDECAQLCAPLDPEKGGADRAASRRGRLTQPAGLAERASTHKSGEKGRVEPMPGLNDDGKDAKLSAATGDDSEFEDDGKVVKMGAATGDKGGNDSRSGRTDEEKQAVRKTDAFPIISQHGAATADADEKDDTARAGDKTHGANPTARRADVFALDTAMKAMEKGEKATSTSGVSGEAESAQDSAKSITRGSKDMDPAKRSMTDSESLETDADAATGIRTPSDASKKIHSTDDKHSAKSSTATTTTTSSSRGIGAVTGAAASQSTAPKDNGISMDKDSKDAENKSTVAILDNNVARSERTKFEKEGKDLSDAGTERD